MKASALARWAAMVWSGALLACSPDNAGITTAVGASAGVGGDGAGDAGEAATSDGGARAAGGTSSDAGAGNSAGEGGNGSISSVRERFARAMCHSFFACADARKDFVVDLLGDEERCVPFAMRAQEVDPSRREQLRLAESGALEVDEAAFATCLELSESCLYGTRLAHESCRRAISGSLANGEACRSSADCNPDSYCQADAAGVDDTCAGKCAARKSTESECVLDEECASDGGAFRCYRPLGSATGTCQAVTLESGLALDAPCGATAVATEGACSGELWCRRDDSHCAEPIARDEPCTDDYDVCERGYFCAGPEGSRTCHLITFAAEEGASCDAQTMSMCDLTLGLECIEGKCQNIGDGGVGTLCGVDSFNCNVGLYCDRESDSCQERLAASAPCTLDRQCQSDHCDATKLCAAEYCGIR